MRSLFNLFVGSRTLAPGPIFAKGRKRIWFHGASAGELESLWPIILNEAPHADLILTVFSRSGLVPLLKLKTELSQKLGVEPLFCGLSPYEGNWTDSFRLWKPDVWVTAKYEAWPELWFGLSLLDIPLVILGAQKRKAFSVARFFLDYVFFQKMPRICFISPNQKESLELQKSFPTMTFDVLPEPRWKRVYDRSEIQNPRSQDLISIFNTLQRPWGILGSVWASDIDVWDDLPTQLPGSLWIVPHKNDAVALSKFRNWVESLGKKAVLSSEVKANSTRNNLDSTYVIVDEMGFLAELYQSMDWAYIGGGFSAGVHSTIEPAIWGIPICCGPKKADRFPEIAELAELNQLSVVTSRDQLQRWVLHAIDPQRQRDKETWIESAKQRLIHLDRGISVLHQRLQMLK